MQTLISRLIVAVLVALVWINAYGADIPDGNDAVIQVKGVLYNDVNDNGQKDSDELPISGIKVSNGIDILVTDKSGQFLFEMPIDNTRCIFPIIPAQYDVPGNIYAYIDYRKGSEQSISIGLRERSEPPPKQFTIVQISDVHVAKRSYNLTKIIEDIHEINELDPAPALVLSTGDLVNNGNVLAQYHVYLTAMKALNSPLINIIGNHDYDIWDFERSDGRLDRTKHWEQLIGPRYFSFDFGDYHILCLDSFNYNHVQKAWVEKDLSLIPKGQPILVYKHNLPTKEQLDFLAGYNTKAIFSGHWHGTREARYKDIININSAPLGFGGIDLAARGFRTIHIDGDSMTFDYRVGGVEKHLAVVSPPSGSTLPQGQIPIVVNAYDTGTQVEQVVATIHDVDRPHAATPHSQPLRQAGNWSWFGHDDFSGVGAKLIEIVVHDVRGEQWRTWSEFRIDEKSGIKIEPGEDWPMFLADPRNTGIAKDAIHTPLALAWATYSGGTINMGSPVISGGKLYIGTLFTHKFDECGVTCLDARTGELLWRAKTDSSIKNSPCVGDGVVYAASVAGTLYAFDTETGSAIWTMPLGSDVVTHWDTYAPKFVDGIVYAGRGYFAAFDGKTGTELWKAKAMARQFLPTIYASPVIAGNKIYFSSHRGLYALDRNTGKRLWEVKRSLTLKASSSLPILLDGKLLCQYGGVMTAFDPETGQVLWKKLSESGHSTEGEKTPSATAAEDLGQAYAGDDTGRMIAFSAQNGQILGSFSVEKGIASIRPYQRNERTIISSPVVTGDLVIFGSTDGYIYLLDRSTMKERQKIYIGAPIASSPAISGNALFIAAYDGNVYAFAAAVPH